MDEFDQEAQYIARNTRRERHHSTCKLSSKGSKASKTCDCWVFLSARSRLIEKYGQKV